MRRGYFPVHRSCSVLRNRARPLRVHGPVRQFASRNALDKRGNELREAHARIEELAQIDDLTGALNRRYIMKALNEEMSRAQRSGTSCSMAIIDLDLIKRINDRYGHPVGDEVLKTFANAVEANVRAVDKLGRYGGEEFLLVLPGSAEDQALIAIDRLGRSLPIRIAKRCVCDGLNVTISAGVSEARENEGPDDILARADAALYTREVGRPKSSARRLSAQNSKDTLGRCDDAEISGPGRYATRPDHARGLGGLEESRADRLESNSH